MDLLIPQPHFLVFQATSLGLLNTKTEITIKYYCWSTSAAPCPKPMEAPLLSHCLILLNLVLIIFAEKCFRIVRWSLFCASEEMHCRSSKY